MNLCDVCFWIVMRNGSFLIAHGKVSKMCFPLDGAGAMRQHGPALQKTSFVQMDEDTAAIQLWMQQTDDFTRRPHT